MAIREERRPAFDAVTKDGLRLCIYRVVTFESYEEVGGKVVEVQTHSRLETDCKAPVWPKSPEPDPTVYLVSTEMGGQVEITCVTHAVVSPEAAS